jgi:histidinol-phosphate aminotransferase
MPLRVRPSLNGLAPYPLGEGGAPGVPRAINLASNENAVRPSEAVLEACRARLGDANRYPEASAAHLRAALGRTFGLAPERIVCANGSSELVSLLAHAYTSPGDEVLMGRHAYLFFETATRVAGATPVRARGRGWALDVETLLNAVTPRTRIVFLDNPNNPTGTHLGRDAVRALRRSLREDILLVLDGAYAEYVTDPDYDAGAPLVEAGGNCVMLRTFSKIYGLAGLRVGWAYTPQGVADVLNRVRQPNSLTNPSLAAAEAALDESERVERLRTGNARLRDSVSGELTSLGLEAVPSQGNFVLIRFPDSPGLEAAGVHDALKRNGVILRPMHPYGLPDCLRMTIGTEEETSTALRIFDAILSRDGSAR